MKNIAGLFLVLIVNTLTHAQMKEAYELANSMVREKLKTENADNIRVLDDLVHNDIVVINGTYDHIHLVLESLKIPFVSINHNELMKAALQPHQTVFVNCASGFPPEAARKLATFVAEGGQLITTDWALKKCAGSRFSQHRGV